MDFAALVAETFRRIGESSTDQVYWNAEDVKGALNEGYLEFCELTRCYTRECEVQTVGRIGIVDLRQILPYPVLGIRTIFGRTVNRPLHPTTVKALDTAGDARWQMNASVPTRYYVRGLYWLGFYPIPPSNESVRLLFTSLPDVLVNDADEPEIPAQFHEALVHYAVYSLKIQEDEFKSAMGAWNDYQTLVGQAAKYTANQIRAPRQWIMGDNRTGLGQAGWYS